MVVAPFETNERHEEVRLSLDDGDPEELVVRVGFEGPGMVVVPVAQVALVSPEVERVLIHDRFLL